ncbi:MAG: c-type cytochrome [Ignavibacteriae bacterium]|jgi:mono/diheme cytochrome c family protein|nr:hypothetical protein [Ignavibacteriota bacterium]NOG98491.1 c-type cytochrome [Ignavibacteriota bacterium]
MKCFVQKTALLFLLISFNLTSAQSTGQDIFSKTCFACHTIGEGKRVGPDLANVHQRRNEEWLIKFIQSSNSLIESGDSLAIAVFEENNKILMPDQPLTELEAKAVIDYISSNSPDPNNPNTKTPKQIFDPTSITQADIDRGKNLFEGTEKFENGGASCISCHAVEMPGVFNGGMLAKDITMVFSRMGAAGVDAIIRTPPFPAMINSFGENPLTDKEVKDLLAFLYDADQWNQTKKYSGNNDIVLIFAVILGLNFVFVLFLFKWNRVKKNSVNSFR